MTSTIQCEFCEKTFSKNYLKKHQSTAKFCLKIQNSKTSSKTSTKNNDIQVVINNDIPKNIHIKEPIIKKNNTKIINLQKNKKNIENQIKNIENYKIYLKKIESILCDYLSLTLSDKEIKKDNISLVVLDLMKLINNYHIKGIDKKTIIVNASQKVINNITSINPDIKTFINIFLPHLIDTFISISKNTFSDNSSSFFPMPICI